MNAQQLAALVRRGQAALHIEVQDEDVAPVLAALQRRADQGVGLIQHGIDIALQAFPALLGLQVQWALKGVVGQLRAQFQVARAQCLGGVPRLGRQRR